MSATARPLSASILKPLARESDLRLVELSRTGDEQAFETLVRRHRHELHVYAARLMGAEGRAEDALQHALMSAWVALRDRGAEVANPRAWLYGIVHNSAVSVLRRARHDTVELNEALEAPHTHDGPETNVIVGEIFAGLAQMPAPQRDALLMTAVAGSSHGEAASVLGVSDGAVRGMVYRARAALRQATAAVFAPGLVNWAAGLGHRRPRLPVDSADAAAATSASAAAATSASAGVVAMVVKGGAVIAAVGALAGAAGPALLPTSPGRSHQRPAAVHRSGPTGHGSIGLPGRLVLPPSVNAYRPSLQPDHALTAIAGTDAEDSDVDGRGHGNGRGSPGEGAGHGDRSGSGDSSGSGRGDSTSNGDTSSSGSSGSGSSGHGSSGSDSSGNGSSGTGSSGTGSSGSDSGISGRDSSGNGSSGSGSSGSGSPRSGNGSTSSPGSGSSRSDHGDTASSVSGDGDSSNPTTPSRSSATPSAGSSSGSGGSGGSGPGPGGANQSSGDAGPAASPATSPASAPGGGDGSGDSGGADGGHSGSGA